MRVYLQPPQPSRGLDRIATALARYAPRGVQIVETEPDLTVIYAIGRRDHIERQCREIVNLGRKYAIIQVCLRSTMSPRVDDWLQSPDPDDGFEGIWLNAHIIWSYYDLNQACVDDGWSLEHDGDSMFYSGQFLHAPLGVDSQVFYPRDGLGGKAYIIACSGENRLQESIRECALAAEEVGRLAFHLGPKTKHQNLISKTGLSDEALAFNYSSCEFVSGLRRTEGFELPAAEGLLCGSRPIVFDTPDYRFNYKDFAVYIPEGSRAEVVESLVSIFKAGPNTITSEEREEAAHWFNWERVCGEFWQRCLQ